MDRVDVPKKNPPQRKRSYASLDKMREQLKFIIEQARIVAESAKKSTQIAKTTL